MKQNHYILACLLPFLLPYSVLGDKSTQHYLTEGNAYLTSGEYNNALTSFDAAIRREPDNYLTYFKRATAYLSLGRNNAAAQDFSTILNLKPDFDQALMQRARIYVKEGDFKLALQDLKRYLNNRPTDTEAQHMLKEVEQAKVDMKQAEVEKENKNYDACISLCSSVSRISPLLAKARLMRAQCHVAKGELEEAAGDFARVAQLNPSDPEILILLSKINFYALNEPQGALTHVKQCLHYDPEQKECKKLFRRIKKLTKELTKIETDVELKKYATASNYLIGTSNRPGLLKEIDQDFEELEKQLIAPSKIPKKLHLTCYELACKLFAEQREKDDDKIEKWCSMTLSIDENNIDALSYRGQVLLNRKEFEAAVRDLEKANELSNSHDAKIRQLLHQAQQKLRLSKKKDYYKMLDISPNADSREIKKAYRKKAHEWHPDKYSGDLEKEQVERKMAEINQAYEVLSDPDKRQQYDNGFDPNDPDQGNQGGGSPFQSQQGGFNFQNGFPFGGEGQGFPGGGGNSFKWQFN